MKLPLFALVVGAICSGPAVASALDNADRVVLIRTAKATGIEFRMDTELCRREKNLMGFFLPKAGELHMCFENIQQAGHDPDLTLKHELIHAAQTCKGGALMPSKNYLPEQELKGMPLEAYPPEQHQTEAEARALAPVFSFVDVARVLVSHCH